MSSPSPEPISRSISPFVDDIHLDRNGEVNLRIKQLHSKSKAAQDPQKISSTPAFHSEKPNSTRAAGASSSPDDEPGRDGLKLKVLARKSANISRKRTHSQIQSEGEPDEDNVSVARRRVLNRNFVNILKTKIPVFADIEADIHQFIDADPLQRQILMYAENLSARRTIEVSLKNGALNTVSPELNANLHAYAWKFGLSPHLKKYKFSWAPFIVAAMKEVTICDLPTTVNEAQFNSRVSEYASKVRCAIKEMLDQSLGFGRKRKAQSDKCKPSNSIINIARNLAAKCSFVITVEFLRRLAILRSICLTYHRDSAKGDFWVYVDTQLYKYMNEHSASGSFEEFESDTLRKDLIAYPRSDGLEGFQDIVVHADMVPESQRIVDKHARLSGC